MWELNFHIVEGGGAWLTLNWYMTLKGTYFYCIHREISDRVWTKTNNAKTHF